MVFTKSAPKLQKVFQDTIFFTKKFHVFSKDFCDIGLKGYYCKENNTSVSDKKQCLKVGNIIQSVWLKLPNTPFAFPLRADDRWFRACQPYSSNSLSQVFFNFKRCLLFFLYNKSRLSDARCQHGAVYPMRMKEDEG